MGKTRKSTGWGGLLQKVPHMPPGKKAAGKTERSITGQLVTTLSQIKSRLYQLSKSGGGPFAELARRESDKGEAIR